jgi:hypothetical protein
VSWYVRSRADADTHRADEIRRDGTVVARCGVVFAPRPLPFDRIALPGHPQDRDQVCPDCKPAKVAR